MRVRPVQGEVRLLFVREFEDGQLAVRKDKVAHGFQLEGPSLRNTPCCSYLIESELVVEVFVDLRLGGS